MRRISLNTLSIFTMLGFFFAATIISSCEKDPEKNPTSNVTIPNDGAFVKNGTLHFTSAETFFKINKIIGAMTPRERDVWEESIGFNSARRELNKIFEKISKCESDEEMDEIYSYYPHLIKRDGDDVIPIIELDAYASICNTDGVFFVDGVIHKVVDNYIMTSLDGNIETINKAIDSKKPIKDGELMAGVRFVMLYENSDPKSGECGTEKTAWTMSSDRKCMLKLSVYRVYCEGCCGNFYYQNNVQMHIYNEKKNWLGRWVGYQSICYWRNVAYTVVSPIVTGFNGVSSTYYYSPITTSIPDGQTSESWENYKPPFPIGDIVQNSIISIPAFDRVKGEAKNSGLSTWAEINCSVWW